MQLGNTAGPQIAQVTSDFTTTEVLTEPSISLPFLIGSETNDYGLPFR